MSDSGARPDHEGHRGRLRKRLAEGGPDALQDYELVEYLLGLNAPRRDTKPLAKHLIDQFGGFGALLAADAKALKRIGKLTDGQVAALKIVHASAIRLAQPKLKDKPVLSSWQALLDYLRVDMGHHPIERVRVLFLDAKNRLIHNEPMWEGAVDESAVHVREIVRRALDYQASGLILVHNHPSGDSRPSPQDIAITKDIIDAARHLRITVHDHVIIGRSDHSSLRALGLM